eukprot:128606_1
MAETCISFFVLMLSLLTHLALSNTNITTTDDATTTTTTTTSTTDSAVPDDPLSAFIVLLASDEAAQTAVVIIGCVLCLCCCAFMFCCFKQVQARRLIMKNAELIRIKNIASDKNVTGTADAQRAAAIFAGVSPDPGSQKGGPAKAPNSSPQKASNHVKAAGPPMHPGGPGGPGGPPQAVRMAPMNVGPPMARMNVGARMNAGPRMAPQKASNFGAKAQRLESMSIEAHPQQYADDDELDL